MTDAEMIERAIQSFAESYNQGDLAAVLEYYEDDLLKVRQGGEPESKKEVERRLIGVFELYDTRVEVENIELEVSGNLAFTRGVFTVTLTPKAGGDTIRAPRRYLEIWRKSGGRWRVARTMDNSG